MPRIWPNQVYNIANRRYFGGKLPQVKIRWDKDLDDAICGLTGFDAETKEPLYIHLNPRYRKQHVLWIATLLHEMVHVELRYRRIKDHGYVFQRRIKELVNQGAFKDLI